MALPVVAIIGRPNVGKSTLVNRLCRSREAIVHDQPGVTRDRTYQEGYWADRTFRVVDTGGLVFDDDSEFLPEIREQANLALAEAAVALVIVDGQQGCTAADQSIAEWLRGQGVPTLLAVNKCESPEAGLSMAAEFWSLGLGEPHPISAIHGAGTGDLLDQLVDHLPPTEELTGEDPIQLAIVGRPNVGKSSLLNLLSQREKAIVTDLPGTTRDLLESELVLDGVPLTLLDTAGIRPTSDRVEQLGIARSREALAAADAVLLLFDLSAGWTAEDAALRALAPEGSVLLVAGNKADAAALPVGLVPPEDGARAPADVSFSAVSGAGRDDLVAELLRRCGAGSLEGVQVALNARQRDLAGAAALSLEASLEAAGQQLPWDFWTIDLRTAVRSLGEITGAEVSEAVLDRVFSRFCIGK